MTHDLYIGLGSNLGNRHQNISQALSYIEQYVGKVRQTSSCIETEPVGFQSDHLFLNAVCWVHTSLTPQECLLQTKEIEKKMGRVQKSTQGGYQDRIIDIDLLMYDEVEICDEEIGLILPHPRMKERDFVMKPLQEICIKK